MCQNFGTSDGTALFLDVWKAYYVLKWHKALRYKIRMYGIDADPLRKRIMY